MAEVAASSEEGLVSWGPVNERLENGISGNAGVVPDCCGEDRAELEGKSFYLSLNLCPNPH